MDNACILQYCTAYELDGSLGIPEALHHTLCACKGSELRVVTPEQQELSCSSFPPPD